MENSLSLFRARPQDGAAWVTGASSGIGREVAKSLAARGYRVIATARSVDKLNTLASEGKGLPGEIIAMPGDVTDETAMAQLVAQIGTEHGGLALAVFNAGLFLPARGERLSVDQFEQTFAVNVMGVVKGLVPAISAMAARGGGQVAIVSSVTGYGGLPLSGAYGASKAALINMAESLKFDFDKMNIRIQVVNPGFVDTPATENNPFPMPALMDVDQAAERIASGLETGGFEITFPRRFTWFLKVMAKLPYPLYFRLVGKGTGWNKRPLKSESKPD